MNDVVRSSFSVNLITLRILGLYPPKNPSKLYLIYGYVMLFGCLIPDPVFSVTYYFLHEELNFLDAGVNLFVIFAMVIYVPKSLAFFNNHKEIRDCIYYLEVFLKNTLNDRQKEMINDSVWVSKRNSSVFIAIFALDNVMWILRPLFGSDRGFPMEVWLPFDPKTSGVVFYSVYLFITIGGTYSVYNAAALDTLVIGLAYHAAGQIKILKDNLQFLNEYAETRIPKKCLDYKGMKRIFIYQKIRECTQHHHQILYFVNKIEKCFSWIVFSQFFMSTLSICFCCFQLIKVDPGSGTFLLMAVYLVSTIIQIYLICYYGATLFDESNTLVTAAYLGRWYEYDIKAQKALLLFMERAKVPLSLTAGKIIDLSLGTFSIVLKRAYSLVALLQTF